MLTLTSDFESDSFLTEISNHHKHLDDDDQPLENLRRKLDLEGEKLNQLSSNNRELSNVQSQLARLRSELEKSEMLRQTLEYELTLLRTQHGKQTAFSHQLQNQLNQSNEQIQSLQAQIQSINQQKDQNIKDKDQTIKQLKSEAETLHDRERRIEALNEQIQKMERSFSDSESLSRKNLAQSILAKERESEFKKEYELILIKLQFNEQALEQERAVSNEAKLNVQLLTTRLSDVERINEQYKNACSNQERKIDELQRQCSNEKLLRSTLSKVQSELETNSAETQKLTIDYEKQLKHCREELSNYRRKFRNNEDKYSIIVNKIFELLRLTKIISENIQHEQNLPSSKQLEDLKLHFEQLRISKIDQTNELSRLKKALERLNKSTMSQKQLEQQAEMSLEKFQNENEQLKENILNNEQTLIRLKNEREHFLKELEKKNSMINSIFLKFETIFGKKSSNINDYLDEFDQQWKTIHLKCNSLEEKLIERDFGTLQLTQKLEEQVLNLKNDFQDKHQQFLKQKDSLLQKHLADIQNLNSQLQLMEKRAIQAEQKINEHFHHQNKFHDQAFISIKYLISLFIPLRRKYFQLLDSYKYLKHESIPFQQIKSIIQPNSHSHRNRFRVFVITIIAMKRFHSLKASSHILNVPSTTFIYDQNILSNINSDFIQSIHSNDVFQSLIFQFNRLFPPILKGSLIKLLAGGIPRSSSTKSVDIVQSLIIRLEQSENVNRRRENELDELRKNLTSIQGEVQSRVDYYQFERICDELQRALEREKQAQDLLNEQNNQLKSLSDMLHQTQKDKDFFQDKFNQIQQNDKHSKDKIQQLTKTHQQMDENVKRAEKAIRLVVTDKEQISAFCTRINSALNAGERRGIDNIEQLITQLDALVQLPNHSEQKKSPPEMILCQNMASGFVHLLNRLKELIINNSRDIQSLKEHCQMLTEQFRQLSQQDLDQTESTQTVLFQSNTQKGQVHHHPQSAFKPIKPDLD